MVNPVVLYVPPALPVLQTGSAAVAPYRPADDTTSFTVSDAVDIQIISGTAAPRLAATDRWSAGGGNGPGWRNDATPGQAAGAYAAAARMSEDTPANGRLTDMSV